MNPENLPKAETEQYDPNLEAQDEDVVSGGNNRLTYILLAVIVALVLVYVALPKGGGKGLSAATPTFMLDDAAVTATVPSAADSVAAGLKGSAAKTIDESQVKDEKATTKPTLTAQKMIAGATVAPATALVATPAPETTEAPAPEPVVAPAAAPEPVAPTNVTMSGKIEDENGRPMIGATVMLKGSTRVTSTDANGNYTLEVPSGSDNTLVYGYGGYDDEVVRSRGSQPVNVTLTPRAKTSRKRR